MFWSLPQAIRGELRISQAIIGVLCFGSFLISVFLGLGIFVVALPSRIEGVVVLGWTLQSLYVFAACMGVWNSAPNGSRQVTRVSARALAVAVVLAQLYLLLSMFGSGWYSVLLRASN